MRRVGAGVAFALVLTACGGGVEFVVPPDQDAAPPSATGPSQAPNQPTTRTPTASGVTQLPPATVAPAVSTTPVLPPGSPAIELRKGTNGRKVVALSFDAGADKGFTAQILDNLKAEGLKVSFGMTGKWAEQNPELFRRIVAEGHHLINHSYSHRSWTGVSSSTAPLNRDQRIAELDRAEQVFQQLAGVTAKPWYRPPFGDIDAETPKLLGQQGYVYNALWTVDSLGWNKKTAAQIAEICRKGYVPGGILLFHVGEQSQDAAALPQIIKEIRAAGLTPGSLLDVV